MSPKTSGSSEIEVVAIGASAGGIEALSRILPNLPKGFQAPVLVVIHMPADKRSLLAELFSAKCVIEVKEAEDKEKIRAGVVYFAPPNYHLLVDSDGTLSLSVEEPVLFSRPSVDVLFESVADAFGPNALGIVLTGASSDGADGLRAICAAGGMAWVQDPLKADVPLMPEAALAACPHASVLGLNKMADLLTGVTV